MYKARGTRYNIVLNDSESFALENRAESRSPMRLLLRLSFFVKNEQR